jgi:hypothetical protein
MQTETREGATATTGREAMTTDRKELVIVELSDGFAVRNTSESPAEYNNYGFLCAGCPTREDAEQFIAEYLAKERERAERMKKAKDEPLPF